MLANALLSVPPRERPMEARRVLERTLREASPGPLLCTDIDFLFEPALSLAPLSLFRNASRATTIIVAWPGIFADGVLTYAVPEHAHYRTWRNPDVHVCALEP